MARCAPQCADLTAMDDLIRALVIYAALGLWVHAWFEPGWVRRRRPSPRRRLAMLFAVMLLWPVQIALLIGGRRRG
ncbi:MAG: hypothetical protein AB1450_13260 [Pseudomonadota bacterium]